MLSASPAAAQSTIAGAVRDSTGAVLPGVTVEASSPVLIEKARATVTNAEGRYTIIDVRPGTYALTFTLAGFSTVRLEEIIVQANVAVPINAEMKIGTLDETITRSPALRYNRVSRMHVAAIIAAGGRGVRLGAGRPKQFLEIGGRSILDLSLDALAASDRIDEIVVALPHEYVAETARSWDGRSAKPLRFVDGGERRQDSVAGAFARTSPHADIIVIHDAARPFVTSEIIARTIDAAATHGAAIAAIAVSDTVKQVGEAEGGSRPIRATIARDTIFLAQTPQAFRREVLERAIAQGQHLDATDEAMLVERLGLPVHVVDGDAKNIKVTTPEDLIEAQSRSESRGSSPGFPPLLTRIGTGYDLHRLVAGRPLILAGVRIPFERGLDGHSDADIVCHAVTDAVLGAAAAGDIGRLFPDTDPKWKDADSIALLSDAIARVTALGYRVSNVDVTVIAQQPKLLPYLDAMRENLAAALQVDRQAVSVKGKTNEGVDSTGRGEAMACHAVALLVNR